MARTRLSQTTKIMPCRVCGVGLVRNGYTRKPQRCVECGIKASCQAMVELQRHSGPYYDQYLAAMRAYATRMGWAAPSP